MTKKNIKIPFNFGEIVFKFKFQFRWNFFHFFPNFWPIIYPRYTIDCMNRTKSEELFYLKKSIFWSSVFNFQNCFKNISDVLRYAKHGMYGLKMTWIFWILNKKIFGKKIWFYAPHLMLAVKNHKQVFPIFGLFFWVYKKTLNYSLFTHLSDKKHEKVTI